MRAVVQRVLQASVVVNDETVGAIERGLLVYLGAGRQDDVSTSEWMARKIATLRVFEDDAGKMSRAVLDTAGEVLVVSQFTLYGDVRNGRRPSFEDAAAPGPALGLYEAVCDGLRAQGLRVSTGRFRAMMRVNAVVDGPVTILIDSARTF